MLQYISYEYSFLFILLLLGLPALIGVIANNKSIFNKVKKYMLKVEKSKKFHHHVYFVLSIIIMNVFFFNSSLANLVGGYLFGLKMGSILTYIGCILSSMIGFYISKHYLHHVLTDMFKKNSIFGNYYKKIDHTKLSDKDSIELVALSRLSPEAPFQLFNLFWGTININWYSYLIGTLVILPVVVFETFLGTQIKNINLLFKSHHKITFIICLLITIFIVWIIDKKIQEIINKQINNK